MPNKNTTFKTHYPESEDRGWCGKTSGLYYLLKLSKSWETIDCKACHILKEKEERFKGRTLERRTTNRKRDS